MAPRIIRDTPTILALLSRGLVLERLDEKLGEVHDALEHHPDDKAKGSLTLTLTLTRKLTDDGSMRIGVQPDISVKLPKEKGFTETPFFLVEGGFSQEHPRQFDLFAGPKEVPAKTAG